MLAALAETNNGYVRVSATLPDYQALKTRLSISTDVNKMCRKKMLMLCNYYFGYFVIQAVNNVQ